jgi:acetyl esterase/lipase
MGRTLILTFLLLAGCPPLLSHTNHQGGTNQTRRPVTWEEISNLPAPPADRRISYGSDPLNFGDLRLPRGPGPHPEAVVVHGGCWRSENDLRHASHLSAALTRAGVATWTIEYRRVGDEGGGWPGTFQDVARGADYVRALARRFPLDLSRVILVGHSAGGQLALWLAARRNLPRRSPLFSADPIRVRGVVSLAGVTDLRGFGVGAAYGSVAGTASGRLFSCGSPITLRESYS